MTGGGGRPPRRGAGRTGRRPAPRRGSASCAGTPRARRRRPAPIRGRPGPPAARRARPGRGWGRVRRRRRRRRAAARRRSVCPGPSLPTASAASAITTGVETTDTPAVGTAVAPRARACASCRVDSGIQTCGGSASPSRRGRRRAPAPRPSTRGGRSRTRSPARGRAVPATCATSGAISGAATIRTGTQVGAASQVRTPAMVSPASRPPAISATSSRWCHGTGRHAACCPVTTPSGRRGPASGVRRTMRDEREVSERVTATSSRSRNPLRVRSRDPGAFPGHHPFGRTAARRLH